MTSDNADSAAREPAIQPTEQLTPGGQVVGTDGVGRPAWAYRSEMNFDYYEGEWGRKIINEHGLLERICLEGFQSGLSWSAILAKRSAFRRVFFLFDATRISAMSEEQREDALADPRLIRNKQKHAAVYANAEATIALRDDPDLQKLPEDSPAREVLGGVANMLAPGLPVLIWSFAPRHHEQPQHVEEIPTYNEEAVAMAKELKRRGFKFVGPVTCYALMQAIGMVNDRVAETAE
ncbi:DNA-3-methyladenine glycosylase I [Corynebacterium suicordis]|uniref:DNA-3-methyladenine glycosylase I n=1 Tax=Corynebacterium suicordis DSM 45110 TaxID=1121369 RepID=A0ABR9ZGF4_9CORY|nr:DNA-3-methyladenine glycosylase I [Corynebacterium suicordis]MBF4552483.1 DNA-3-methyladenine glycosylase I [Corynebacterium suicordis DSM 45110]MDR6278558.1 DNA-3-methyladenine glycosylase I [Corynebacterium suicordis]